MKRRTKIVATIGPASGSAGMISKLLDNGVNVFRLNFSHGTQEQHRQQAAIIRQVLAEKKMYAAILGDLQGPKIRIGDLPNEPLVLEDGAVLTLTIDKDKQQTDQCIFVQYQPLPASVKAGDTLLLDDGLMRLTVESVETTEVHCRIDNGGLLKSRKGLNRLGGGLSAPAITDKDRDDIRLAAELSLDYLAVSFPSCAQDLLPVKEQLAELGARIDIIAKIERAEAVASEKVLDELIKVSDGVMVARGDLGVEIGDAQLIGVQKKIIRKARQFNRPVITATQMMESMINAPVPTRAEVFDVANAVLDGTDAVMLSAETASGKYPAQVVAVMAKTCVGAEQHPDIEKSRFGLEREVDHIDETIALTAIYAATHLRNVAAIICLTESGRTPLYTSRLSSELPIYGISRHTRTCNRMALYRGVVPLHFDILAVDQVDDAYNKALQTIALEGHIKPGQKVAIMCGGFSETTGGTDTLKIMEYKG
jgi:pyruvate kinase